MWIDVIVVIQRNWVIWLIMVLVEIILIVRLFTAIGRKVIQVRSFVYISKTFWVIKHVFVNKLIKNNIKF